MNKTVYRALNYCGVTATPEIEKRLVDWFDGWDPCDAGDFETAIWSSVVEFCELYNLGRFQE